MKYYKKKSRKVSTFLPYRYTVALSDIKNKKNVGHVFPVFNTARGVKRGKPSGPDWTRPVAKSKGEKRERPVAQRGPSTPASKKKPLINKDGMLYEGSKYAGALLAAYQGAKVAKKIHYYHQFFTGKLPQRLTYYDFHDPWDVESQKDYAKSHIEL